jgi:hypothetical protein
MGSESTREVAVIDARVAPSKPRWKVQLELAPAEIALVYRQGLARGAEVCRRGTHEWRPLVTTPELRPALVGRSSWPDIEHAVLIPPRVSTVPDSAVTQPLPTRALPPPPVLPQPLTVHDSHSELPAAVTSVPPPALSVRHARSSELSLVAVLSFVATLGAALFAQHASHWTEARAQITSGRPASAPPAHAVSSGTVEPAVWAGSVTGNAPVVTVHDLPLEQRGVLTAAPPIKGAGRSASPSSTNGGGRNDFARAMAQAAHSAQGCGEGPVHTQVVATFAPSGVPSSVHFGSAPPPAALRSCVLSAVARARVSPFEGDPVTVSKTLSW